MDTDINSQRKSVNAAEFWRLCVKNSPRQCGYIHSCRSDHHTAQATLSLSGSILANKLASFLRQLTIPRCSHQLVEQSSHLSLGGHGGEYSFDTGNTLRYLLSLFREKRGKLIACKFVKASPLEGFHVNGPGQLLVLIKEVTTQPCCLKVIGGLLVDLDQS